MGEVKDCEDFYGNGYSVDTEKLRQIIAFLKTWLDDKRRLTSEKKADLITLLYKHFIETKKEVEDQTVVEYLRLVS
jgi:hypothetical protein